MQSPCLLRLYTYLGKACMHVCVRKVFVNNDLIANTLFQSPFVPEAKLQLIHRVHDKYLRTL